MRSRPLKDGLGSRGKPTERELSRQGQDKLQPHEKQSRLLRWGLAEQPPPSTKTGAGKPRFNITLGKGKWGGLVLTKPGPACCTEMTRWGRSWNFPGCCEKAAAHALPKHPNENILGQNEGEGRSPPSKAAWTGKQRWPKPFHHSGGG